MSRASCYRHGKPGEKPQRKVLPNKQMAGAFGVSVRTIQRDHAAAERETVADIRRAKAEGRALDVATVQDLRASYFADKCRERETAAMKAVEAGLESLQRIAALPEDSMDRMTNFPQKQRHPRDADAGDTP